MITASAEANRHHFTFAPCGLSSVSQRKSASGFATAAKNARSPVGWTAKRLTSVDKANPQPVASAAGFFVRHDWSIRPAVCDAGVGDTSTALF